MSQFQLSGQQVRDLAFWQSTGLGKVRADFTIDGTADKEIIFAALATITDRHDILRTSFVYRAGINLPFQTVASRLGIENKCFTTTALSLEQPLSITVEFGDAVTVVMKALRLILDIYTVQELQQEIQALINGVALPVATDELLQFGTYTEWELGLTEEGNMEAAAFWNEKRKLVSKDTGLFKPVKGIDSSSCVQAEFDGTYISSMADELQVPEQVLLLALFKQSLCRYTDGKSLTIDCLTDGRVYEELKMTLGPLSRLYPVHFSEEQPELTPLLAHISAELQMAANWNDYYYALPDDLWPDSRLQFVFEFLESGVRVQDDFTGSLKLRVVKTTALWKLELVFPAGSDMMALATLFMADLGERLQQLDLPVLHINEKDKAQLQVYNATCTNLSTLTLPEMIRQVFSTRADSIAVQGANAQVTYHQLAENVGHIVTALLQDYSIAKGDVVGILMDDDMQIPAALLGVWFAGAAYVPLDRHNPAERLQHMIRESKCKLIITDKWVPEQVKANCDSTELVDIAYLQLAKPAAAIPVTVEPWDTAYLIFTSGTTGIPKGCQLLHSNLMNYIYWANGYYFKTVEDGNFPLLTNLSFDLTVTSIFTTLSRGRTLYCLDPELSLVEKLKYCFSNTNGIDTIKLTPTHISLLADVDIRDSAMKCVIVGGEELRFSQVELLRTIAPGVAIYNEYGPTEATVGCIVKLIEADDEQINIGRPIANMEVLVLDAEERILPVGVAGELYIAGAGLAKGYWEQPEITAAKFKTLFGQRYYKTGDLVRLLPAGDMAFYGRIDEQVKIRGNRVELGEIQNCLSRFEGIEQVLVMLKKNDDEEKYITAYYLSDDEITAGVLQAFLLERLPDYMVPAFFIPIDKIPLTANGKLDPKQLPDPFIYQVQQREYLPPVSEMEKLIAAIWGRILRVEQVGVNDDFFELGGHSLLAMRIVSAMRKELVINLVIKDLLGNPTIKTLAHLIEGMQEGLDLPQVTVVAERPLRIPLSYAQERLWFIDQLRGSVHYHMPSVFRLLGSLDVYALECSFNDVVNRHESLRTVFKELDGIPYQEILAEDGWMLDYLDTYNHSGAALDELVEREITRPFDLSKDHPLRAMLLRIKDDEHILILLRHHIAADGWSGSLLVHEFETFYRARTGNKAQDLPVLSLQYADYAIWQRTYVVDEVLEKQLGYWEEKLRGLEPLNLPLDYPRPAVQSTEGARLNFVIDKAVSDALVELAQQQGVTLFMLLLSVYQVMLSRYSGQTDICVGTTVADRSAAALEPLIGFFVNTLVLRSDLSENPVYREFLLQVKRTTLEGYEHLSVPFEKVVDRVEQERDKSRSSLFQALLVLNNNEDAAVHSLGGLRIEPESLRYQTAKFDLTFFVQETASGIAVSINYCVDLFSQETIAGMKGHFENLLSAVLENIEQPVGSLAMLGEQEKEQLLHQFNHFSLPYPAKTVIALFEEQVLLHPDQAAVRFGDVVLSYGELNARASKLGSYLRQTYNLVADDLVGMMMDTAEWSVVSILGILKAGAAYVPIDIALPKERQVFMVRDTGMKALLITSEHLFDVLDFEVPVFSVDIQLAELEQGEETESVNGDLAYVIYTSGTTGQPKGVMVRNQNIVDYYFGLKGLLIESSSFGLMSSLSADLGNTVLFGSLLSGGTLHLFSKPTLMDPELLHSYFSTHPIDCIKIVPSHWTALETLLPEKTIIFGGEALPVSVIAKIRTASPLLRVINHYGPTETTIGKLLHQVDLNRDYHQVPIGRPFSNTVVYVADRYLALCPVGVPGELLIGGDGVSAGYFNQPEQTSAKFIANPFGGPSRLYKTGDLVRRLADGDIEFIGRVDDQVKIRGYRVELGEVNKILSDFPGIQQSAVVYTHQRLMAYVVAEGAYDQGALMNYMKQQLPEYMVPAVWIPLTAMPLTANGKLDKKALPAPDALVETNYVAPRNELEEGLAEIWISLLNADRVGIYDNFFELGGHSLLAIRILSAIRKQLNVEVVITDLFDYVTIAALSEFIELNDRKALLPAILRQERPLRIPLSYAQERLWFIDQLRGSTHYHMPSVFRLHGQLDVQAMEKSFKEIVGRHESLRTVFREVDGLGYQEIVEAAGWRLDRSDAIDLDKMIEHEVTKSFDLAQDYMMRAKLLKIKEDEHVLVLVRHHIASDGWSVSLIVHEFIELYRFYTENRLPDLPVLSLQYADYAIWQRTYVVDEVLEKQLGYWEEKLRGLEPLNLPLDYPRPAVQSTEGARLNFVIDKAVSDALVELAQQQGVTLFMLLLSVYQVMLSRYSGQTDICVGTTVADRSAAALEPLIGFFVNTLVLRSDLSENPVYREFLLQVKRTTLEGYEHLSVPFEKVVDRVEQERDKSRSSLFQALLVLNNNEDAAVHSLGGLRIEPESLRYQTAKFDLTFFVQETASGIAVSINYCVDLFSQETIAGMKGHFENLLSAVLENIEQPVGSLAMLGEQEKEQLLHQFNHFSLPYPAKTVIALFEEQVLLHPDQAAVRFGDVVLSYGELNARASKLGSYLRQTYNLAADDLVGMMMDTAEWSVVSILGILKAGAAYVPIDIALPKERQVFMVRDTGMKALLITSEHLFDVLDFEVPVFSVDIQLAELEQGEETESVNGDLAYVIYTSGTTGQPKGVMVRNQNIVDYYFGLKGLLIESSSFGLMSSLSADLGNTVLFGSLLSGGTLHLFSKPTLMDPGLLHSYFSTHPIDCIKIVPSHWTALETLLPEKTIIFGGEALPVSVIAKIRTASPLLRVINHYGPTETTIGKLLHQVDLHRDYHQVPIGRPFSNTVVYVADRYLALCPVGVPGELLIGGDGVSAGYFNQPEQTSEKFIANPFGGPSRLYKTGDLVRRLADGDIEFIGRVDDQVKIRGYRVELGEVNKVLSDFPGIQQSAVVYTHQRLMAYVVTEGAYDQEALMNYMKQQLPEYMVPAVWIPLTAMPLTANGKLDKKALPAPDALVETNYVAPRNELEEDLAEIWISLLNADRVGIYDNFFELGGDSIIVIQLVSRAKRKGYHVQVQDLFDYQTIADLAALILRNKESAVLAEQGRLTGEVTLLPIQHWFLETGADAVNHFNQAVLLQLDKKVSAAELLHAVKIIVDRHDILRCFYTYKDAQWIQEYGDREGELEVVESACAEITAVCEQYQESLDIEEGILSRFVLIQTPEEEAYNRFFMVVHHLAIDGVSWRILIDELSSLLAVSDAELGLKTSSYRDWAETLVEFAFTERIRAQQSYWENVVQAFKPMPVELNEAASARKDLSAVDVQLSTALTQLLLTAANTAYNTEINDLLLTALAITIREWLGDDDVVIGLEGHGREALFPQLDVTGTLGWFTNKYPVLLQLESDMQEGSMLKSVKEQLRSIPDKGIGFGCLKYLNPVEELSGDCWDIVFNYLGQQDNVVNANAWFKGAPEYPGDHISSAYPIRDKFVIRAIVTGNVLHVSFNYSSTQYTAVRVEKFAAHYIRQLSALINHCVEKEERDVTPADFGLNGKLDYKELDALLGKGALEDEGDIMRF
ncbi:amino acid adenylation domain-containing protein [Pedobacter sp. WC2423]|uniref:amino acid adenylation domain-containing protein n=1 Tax=Pedobacter sp. WC2423 TaxID=3234142 RepID=UPI0034677BF4